MANTFWLWYAVAFVALQCPLSCQQTLPAFSQPGPGVVLKRWSLRSKYSIEEFSRNLAILNCPRNIKNTSNFTYEDEQEGNPHKYGLYVATFVSTQSGIHTFFARCSLLCEVFINKQQGIPVQLLQSKDPAQEDDPRNSYLSLDINLSRGFRYQIKAYHYGNTTARHFFQLGIQFPNSTVLNPITSEYLWRSAFQYKWDGLLVRRYKQFDSATESILTFNDNPTSVSCRRSLTFKPASGQNHNALQITGYLKVPKNSTYWFQMKCNYFCNFYIRKPDQSFNMLINARSSQESSDTSEIKAVKLMPSTWYPIEVTFIGAPNSSRELKFAYKYSDSDRYFSDSWPNMLYSLSPDDVQTTVHHPKVTKISSTSVLVKLEEAPHLQLTGYSSNTSKHEIVYRIHGVPDQQPNTLQYAKLKSSLRVTGLRKNTEYEFYAHYFGEINGKEHNVVSSSVLIKTAEDVPESAPAKVTGSAESTSAIRLVWKPISDIALMNGKGTGYEIQYRIEDIKPSSWKSNIVRGIDKRVYVIRNLKPITVYEVRVAARTVKGSGVFSNVIRTTTKGEYEIGEERSFAFHTNILLAGKSLKDHVREVIPVKTVEECFEHCRLCIEEKAGCICASFNIRRKIVGGNMECEINTADDKEYPSDLVSREEYQYYIVIT